LRAYELAKVGRFEAALALADGALLRSASAQALDAAGNALILVRCPGRAERLFRRAVELAPDNDAMLGNLAATLRFLGRIEEAEQLYEQIIARATDAFEALKLRSDIRTQTPQRNHIAELQRRSRQPDLPWRGEMMLAYALGKECEDVGRYDDAFAAFERGARIRRTHMQYAVRRDIEVMSELRAVFLPDRHVTTAGLTDHAPIFILGLPRSGSTLLDRMLSRHPAIESLDEPQAFMLQVIRQAEQQYGRPANRRAFVEATAQLDRKQLASGYLAALAPLRGHEACFIDKLPLNFLYLGLIATALPNATLVHLRREPRDACMAMFKTLFEAAYPFSYDLGELGAYHRAYRQLMDHWDRCFAGRVIHLDYEDLVAQPEPLLTRVLSSAGLEWDARCLEPQLSPDAALTQSTLQVREPVHGRSVGAWRNYERHLAPLHAAL
jgi:tetratricopeptide (TPR) repeat protein